MKRIAFASLVAVASIILGACGTSVSTTQRRFTSVAMTTSTTGWAATKVGLFYTHNDGHTWQDVTPFRSSLQGAIVHVFGRTAWVVRYSKQHSIEIDSTTSNGRKWRRLTILRNSSYRPSAFGVAGTDMEWLLLQEQPSSGYIPAKLYISTNGGAAWQLASDTGSGSMPTGGKLTLLNSHTAILAGFGIATLSHPLLYMSSNGAKDWVPIRLPSRAADVSVGIVADRLVRINATLALLVLHTLNVPSSMQIYSVELGEPQRTTIVRLTQGGPFEVVTGGNGTVALLSHQDVYMLAPRFPSALEHVGTYQSRFSSVEVVSRKIYFGIYQGTIWKTTTAGAAWSRL